MIFAVLAGIVSALMIAAYGLAVLHASYGRGR